MKAQKTKSPLVERALKLADLAAEGLEQPRGTPTADLTEGVIKAVRGQHTEWCALMVDDATTGILIYSAVLDADIWLALCDDFQPDPELPSFAVFYAQDILFLKSRSVEQLKEIHEWKLKYGLGARIRQ